MFCLAKKKIDIDKINYKTLEETELIYIDYRMLSSVANIYFKLNRQDESIQLLYSIVSSLNTKFIPVSLKKDMLDLIYFNLSTNLLDAKRYKETMDICNMGVDWCKKIKTTRYLGEFYSNKAEAYAYLQNTKKAHHYFTLACEQFKRDGELKKAEITRVGALEIHGITIE